MSNRFDKLPLHKLYDLINNADKLSKIEQWQLRIAHSNAEYLDAVNINNPLAWMNEDMACDNNDQTTPVDLPF